MKTETEIKILPQIKSKRNISTIKVRLAGIEDKKVIMRNKEKLKVKDYIYTTILYIYYRTICITTIECVIQREISKTAAIGKVKVNGNQM